MSAHMSMSMTMTGVPSVHNHTQQQQYNSRNNRNIDSPSSPYIHTSTSNKQQNNNNKQANIVIDAGSSVVLNPYEYGAIRSMCSTQNSSTLPLHQQHNNAINDKRSTLRELSRQRYTNWGNTLEALRSKKKVDRIVSLDELEKSQQALDGEESHYAEAQRRIVIDRANRLLYQENDKVKNFHSGLLLSSVVKQREAQIELKNKKKEQQKEQDKQWVYYAELDRIKAIETEQKEQAERQAKSLHLATTQLEQLNLSRLKNALERQEEIKDGERLRRIAMDSVIESELEEQRKCERQRAMNHEYIRANEEQRQIRSMLREEQSLEEIKIARFAAEKERLSALRKEHESAKFAAKQARHEQMWKRQYAHLSQLQNKEKERIEKQIIEIQQRNDSKLAAQEAKAKAERDAMIASREEQLRRRESEKAIQAEHDKIMAAEWRKKNREMEELEEEHEIAIKKTALKLQSDIRKQMIDKEQKNRLQAEKEREEAKAMKEARDREDQVFNEYTKTVMAATAAKGKSTIPMQLVLHHENSNLRFFK